MANQSYDPKQKPKVGLIRQFHWVIRFLRHRKCKNLAFMVAFVCGVFIVSYHWHEFEKRHNSSAYENQDIHRNKVEMVERYRPGFEPTYPTHNEQDRIQKWHNPGAITMLKPGVLGNYELHPDLTHEMNRNGNGEHGVAVDSAGHEQEMEQAMEEFGFNTFASDKISLNRSIPDTRHEQCQYWHYPSLKLLPNASVVIVFTNEGWSPLLRTVHSVLLRSPPELLYEIVMVDDFSDKRSTIPAYFRLPTHLKGKLERYLTQFKGKVRLIRNTEREGLIRSRSIGAQHARGDVVIFLDAHCEANHNWLPPLLAPIAKDRKVMTVPVIDGIEQDTFEYRKAYGGATKLFKGIFEWGLLYKESELSEDELMQRKHETEPFKSPTHAGGLFAIDRRWFKQLGYYDPGLNIWGGEQYELSFKIWQCGGGILFVPCSRVGHVYRDRVPYTYGKLRGPTVQLNHKRVAKVWMDDYAEYFYRRHPGIIYSNPGDITKQLALRRKNKCKSFKWYMENVASDVTLKYPEQPENLVWGTAKNPETGLCIDALGNAIPGKLAVYRCHGGGGTQLFRLNVEGQMVSGEWCVTGQGHKLHVDRCPFGVVSGKWSYDKRTKQIRHGKNDCATVDRSGETDSLELKPCEPGNRLQQWVWKKIFDTE